VSSVSASSAAGVKGLLGVRVQLVFDRGLEPGEQEVPQLVGN
jgi:hypothetical protein